MRFLASFYSLPSRRKELPTKIFRRIRFFPLNTIFGRVKYNIFYKIFKFLLDTMGEKSKCYLLFIIMICAILITMGSIFNVLTIAAIPSCVPQRMQHTNVEIVEKIGEIVEEIGEIVGEIVEEIGEIVEEIGEKVPKCEIPALVWIILFDLLIILAAMVPKMTFDQCKRYFEGKKRWNDVALLTSATVSF